MGKSFVFLFCLLGLSAQAADVALPAKSVKICVGEKKKIIQLKNQAEWWQVNGQGSSKSTWTYRGANSNLTCDTDTADVVASCKQVGSETYAIKFKVAYTDPNNYTINYTVECVPCVKEGKIKKLSDGLKAAIRLIHQGKTEKAEGKIDDMIKEVEKLLEDEDLDDGLREYLQGLLAKLRELKEKAGNEEEARRLGAQIDELLKRLREG